MRLNSIFLLDNPRTSSVVELAKEVLEDGGVCKIVHDCKADSDALFHILGINLNNVHDTQVAFFLSKSPFSIPLICVGVSQIPAQWLKRPPGSRAKKGDLLPI